VAEAWADDTEDSVVVCRTLNAACRGRGIVLAHNINEVVEAPLYTRLFTGRSVREYRVYVVDGRAVDITEKQRRGADWCDEHGVDRDDEYTQVIRTHGNGWVFARHNFHTTPAEQERIKEVAVAAANSIDMGLGAVDMITRRSSTTGELVGIRAVETNTSVGIERGATSTRLLAEGIAESLREVAS
jgi:hypothetical protein